METLVNLDKKIILNDVQRALTEDVGTGDVSAALLPAGTKVTAMIVSREPMVVAGIPWVEAVFEAVDASVDLQWDVKDGQVLNQPQRLCTLIGEARSILTAERTALNFLQTLSGTATKTRHYVAALTQTNTQLLDTRKTLPGLRYAQKHAVLCGGGKNHRFGLFDAYLIKENHIRALGSVTRAVEFAQSKQDNLLIEVEVENLQQLAEALLVKPHRILLDNFSIAMLSAAVEMNQPHVCDLEASGGITLENIALVAQTGVDYISIGALTKSVESIDLSLLVEEK
jgi:nicotinate-nucleotide pyrophosphorylase (carboxylating)